MKRKVTDINEAIERPTNQVWHNRHQSLWPSDTTKEIWLAAQAAAEKIEDEIDDLGPWTDFDWGMINGKLSALRWVLGDDWDMLDT